MISIYLKILFTRHYPKCALAYTRELPKLGPQITKLAHKVAEWPSDIEIFTAIGKSCLVYFGEEDLVKNTKYYYLNYKEELKKYYNRYHTAKFKLKGYNIPYSSTAALKEQRARGFEHKDEFDYDDEYSWIRSTVNRDYYWPEAGWHKGEHNKFFTKYIYDLQSLVGVSGFTCAEIN